MACVRVNILIHELQAKKTTMLYRFCKSIFAHGCYDKSISIKS